MDFVPAPQYNPFTMAHLSAPQEFTLSNGIPVIFQQLAGEVAATYWWVQAGSADELPKEAGFAHFLEHMHFKDPSAKSTGKASTGEIARAIESFGGDINAYTSFDQTVYHFTAAELHWEKTIETFGNMAKPQKFLKKDFEQEREVILEELKKNNDSPGRQLFQSLFETTYKKHPYGKPVIGFVRTLNAAKVADLERFYKRSYVSERMGIIMVGPYTEARQKNLLKILERKFGSKVIAKRGASLIPRAKEPEFRAQISTHTLQFDVQNPALAFSFRVPDLQHKHVAALDLTSNILAFGELSRLYQKLFQQKSLVTDISGGLYVPADPGLQYFQIDCENTQKLEESAMVFLDELKRLRSEGPTDQELKRVLVNAESERLYSTQSADGVAGRIGFMKFVLGNMNYDRDFLDSLREVDADAVQEIAERYYIPERMGIVALMPKKQAFTESMAKIVDHAKKTLQAKPLFLPQNKPLKKGKATESADEKSILPKIWITEKGTKVVYLYRPESPIFSLHAACLGGLRLDPIHGASHLLSTTWTQGTLKKTSQEIAAIIEGHAASIDGFDGKHTIGLQMMGLARDFHVLYPVFNEVLMEPSFPEDELAHSKRVVEDSIRSLDDHSSQLCSKLFLETLFDQHPYGKLTIGTLESLSQIDRKTLLKLHSDRVVPSRLTLTFSGNIGLEAVENTVRDLEVRSKSSPSKGSREIQTIAFQPPLNGPRWAEKSLGREQVHIIVGGLGPVMPIGEHLESKLQEHYAFKILQNILGGQSGRLFIELREKKSLAYTVSPLLLEGIEPGYVGTYIACAREKKDEALKGIREVYEVLAKKGPSDSEMKRAVEYYLGRRAMDMQGDSSLASHYGLEAVYGMPPASTVEVAKRLRKVTRKQIQALCKKYFLDPPQVICVVG